MALNTISTIDPGCFTGIVSSATVPYVLKPKKVCFFMKKLCVVDVWLLIKRISVYIVSTDE